MTLRDSGRSDPARGTFVTVSTPLVERLLEPPSYGFSRAGTLYKPSTRELLLEFCTRLDVVRNRKNWVAFVCWLATLALAVPLVVFAARYFSWVLLGVAFAYAMIVLGTHGTVYLHRYSTHRAYVFSSPVARFLCAHAVIKIVPEELYVVSHHVHHKLSDRPGDPYNAEGGFLYCFLADANHQPIARDLSESDYRRASKLLAHTGVRRNSYAQYQRWGSIAHPVRTVIGIVLNWAFWYAAFFAMGGHALATALFGASFVWGVGVRTFNYGAHGSGKDARRPGLDFSDGDRSINQLFRGLVSGEWHSNHHLYPRSARAGFLRWQLDTAWLAIRAMAAVGVVKSYRDDRAKFLGEHYEPRPLVSNGTCGAAPLPPHRGGAPAVRQSG